MLKLGEVSKVYRTGTFGRSELTAVKNVSFGIEPGEVVSLIGESGSGKTTIGKMVLRLVGITSGTITVDGTDISTAKGRALKEYYRHVQGVFQDPFSSYNPIFKADRVFAMVKEQYYPQVDGDSWEEKVRTTLQDVRLDPDAVLNKYPHQLSGGQLQRMLIARALLLDIKLLVADEIISMLDASTRIDVLNLLADLKARGLGILFITHDLALGNYISDKTLIMHKGIMVEMGETAKVFGNPQHPYTRNLLACVPQLERKWDDVAAELGLLDEQQTESCAYHRILAENGHVGPVTMHAEVEEGHLVACAHASDPASCPWATAATVR